ncbi:MAG: NADH:ubiquinone reductase (Na(+)-transporting) subunit E [Spirochaetales bacterium]|nr:MAG: NADH:ubiquinone reductase (Na(+)-transporting) subunit E [Spirochaetales bacterium]
MSTIPLANILFGSIFTNNILFASFLGMCSFLVCSNKIDTAIGLGSAVTFVLACTAVLNFLIYHFILKPLGLEFVAFIIFIAVIAAFTQFVELFVERFSPGLYYALGIFLPLITVNCAILGASLFMVIRDYNFVQTVFYGFGAGLGWALAILLMAGLREKMGYSNVPVGLRKTGIVVMMAGVIAMTFMGFSGMLSVQ